MNTVDSANMRFAAYTTIMMNGPSLPLYLRGKDPKSAQYQQAEAAVQKGLEKCQQDLTDLTNAIQAEVGEFVTQIAPNERDANRMNGNPLIVDVFTSEKKGRPGRKYTPGVTEADRKVYDIVRRFNKAWADMGVDLGFNTWLNVAIGKNVEQRYRGNHLDWLMDRLKGHAHNVQKGYSKPDDTLVIAL